MNESKDCRNRPRVEVIQLLGGIYSPLCFYICVHRAVKQIGLVANRVKFDTHTIIGISLKQQKSYVH